MEYLVHPLLDEGRIREPKSRSVLRACKFARQPEESGAQFAQGQALPFFGETCPLKSRDQVIGQPNYFQVEDVGRESASGNLPQREVVTNFANAWLHSGAAIVEVPHPCWCQRQVRVPGAIRVTFQGKQSRLRIGLLDPPPRHNAAACVRPIVWTVLKFRDLPTRIHLFIAQTLEGILQGAGHTRDHGVLGQTRFQHLQYGSVAEAGIGPHAYFTNVGRGGVKTTGQEFLAARPGSRIAASQFHIPEERGVRFQAEQRVIGPLAAIARVVANRRPFLMAESFADWGNSEGRSNIETCHWNVRATPSPNDPNPG